MATEKKIDVGALRKRQDQTRMQERVLAFGIAEVLKTEWNTDGELVTPHIEEWKRAATAANEAQDAYYSSLAGMRVRRRRRVVAQLKKKKKAAPVNAVV